MTINKAEIRSIVDYYSLRGDLIFIADAYSELGWHSPQPSRLSSKTIKREVPNSGLSATDNLGTGDITFSIQSTGTRTASANFNSYLRPLDSELASDYIERWRSATYINLVKPIAEAYVDALTSGNNRKIGELEPFLKNVGNGKSYKEFIKDLTKDLILYAVNYILVLPPTSTAANWAEQKMKGEGCQLISINPTQIAWIGMNLDNEIIEMAWIDTPFQSFEDVRVQGLKMNLLKINPNDPSTAICCQHWNPNSFDRFGSVLKDSYFNESTQMISQVILPLVNGKLPLISAVINRDNSKNYPFATSMVSNVAAIGKDVYNTLSAVNQIHRFAAAPILTIGVGEGASRDSASIHDIGLKNALLYKAGGQPQYLQPSSESTKELREHISWLISKAYNSCGLEVLSDKSQAAQSGLALSLKMRDFDEKCKSIAETLKGIEIQILQNMNYLMGMEGNEIIIEYPPNYVGADPIEQSANLSTFLKDFGSMLPQKVKEMILKKLTRLSLSIGDSEVESLFTEEMPSNPISQEPPKKPLTDSTIPETEMPPTAQ
jgi:hypothetical protein